jgi:hypothetical protein
VTLWPVAIAAVAIAACAPRDREVRLARVQSEGLALRARLDELHVRLLADQARVRYWEETRGRHQGVAAVACSNLDAHALAMARRQLLEDARSAPLAARPREHHRTRVAALGPRPSSAPTARR